MKQTRKTIEKINRTKFLEKITQMKTEHSNKMRNERADTTTDKIEIEMYNQNTR